MAFLTIFRGLSSMVPTTIVSMLEMQRLFHKSLVQSDINMEGVRVQNVEVLEDVVPAYVICDKTGTLTKNEMLFRACTVGNGLKSYPP